MQSDEQRAAAEEVGAWYVARLRPKLIRAARESRRRRGHALEVERQMRALLGSKVLAAATVAARLRDCG